MKVTGLLASRSSTACILGFGDAGAKRYNEAIFHWIEKERPGWVVLVSRWEVMLWDKQVEAQLRETVARIRALGVNVAIMRLVPESGHSFHYDNQHLTRYGSRYLAPMFATLFDRPSAPGMALQAVGKLP